MKWIIPILFCVSIAYGQVGRYPFYVAPTVSGGTITVYVDADNRDAMSDWDDHTDSKDEAINCIYLSDNPAADNTYWDEDCQCYLGEWTVGHNREGGVQFQLAITKSTTITTCVLSLVVQSSNLGAGQKIRIYAYTSPATVFDDAHTHKLSEHATITTSYIEWERNSWSAGTRYDSPELNTLLQEVVDGADWDSGDYVGFVLVPDYAIWTDGASIRFNDYSEVAETSRAKLSVTY